MRITIKNRNRGASYGVDEGCVIRITKDETLDRATAVVSNLSAPIDIEPFDEATLTDETGRWPIANRTMCVDSYVRTQTCVSPAAYRYEIRLFSKTKELEGVLLPCLKITKMPGRVKTIWEYMEQYLSEYSPLIRVESGGSYVMERRWTLDQSFASAFSDECPEMQWNRPTLREVLNDLAMVKDRIAVLQPGNKVGFISLTSTDLPSSEATGAINYITSSRSSDDYVSALRMEMENVTNDRTGGINNYATMAEWFPITSEDALMTDQDMEIKTKYPIYKLNKMEMLFPGSTGFAHGMDTRNLSRWFRANLLDCTLGEGGMGIPHVTYPHRRLVYETKEWEVLDVNYDQWSYISVANYPKYRNFTFHYTRGDNRIVGFSEGMKRNFLTVYALTSIKKALASGALPMTISVDVGGTPTEFISIDDSADITPWYMTFFHIEYETLEGCVFEAGKGVAPRHVRVVADGQTNSYVDSYSQGILEYMKANRLGNEQLAINATYRSPGSDMLGIGDEIDGCVVYDCEYQIYKDHVETNAYATKDYVLRNYFTGVRSKIRSWAIASGDQALTRHDAVKYYLELCDHEEYDSPGLFAQPNGLALGYDYAWYFTSSLRNNPDSAPLRYCLTRTSDSAYAQYPPGASEWYLYDLIERLVGDSIVFTLRYDDSYWAGKYIDIGASDITASSGFGNMTVNQTTPEHYQQGGLPTQHYTYCDANGENVGGTLALCSEFLLTRMPDETGDDAQGQDPVDFVAASYALPKVDIGASASMAVPEIGLTYAFSKDSQEITAISAQFEFCRSSANIAFGRAFIERQDAIRVGPNQHTYRLLIGQARLYNPRSPKAPALPLRTLAATVSTISDADGVSAEISISTQTSEAAAAYINERAAYLVDETGELLLAFGPGTFARDAGSDVTVTTCYLNAKRLRDPNIYDSASDENVASGI